MLDVGMDGWRMDDRRLITRVLICRQTAVLTVVRI